MNKKLKIAHLTSVHRSNDVRIFHKECVSFAEQGHEVTFIIPNASNCKIQNVSIISFQHKAKNRLSRMILTVNKLYKHALELNADIYHFHDPELLRIGLKLKRKGKIVIYDAHEDLPRQILAKPYIPHIMRRLISYIIERYENFAVSKLSGIVAATPFIRDRFLKFNSNTIDVNNFPIIKELNIDIEYESKKENYICYVGGITRVRGIIEIVNAIENANVNLLLAGNFLDIGLKEEIKSKKGWAKVNELGFLDRAGIKDVYIKSKIGLVTLYPIINHLNALPVKMFEYMAAGLPIIASNFDLWKQIIENNNVGLCVDPKNPDEITSAIEYILSNPSKAKDMGENGKKLVKEKYNWNNECKKLFKLYKDLTTSN